MVLFVEMGFFVSHPDLQNLIKLDSYVNMTDTQKEIFHGSFFNFSKLLKRQFFKKKDRGGKIGVTHLFPSLFFLVSFCPCLFPGIQVRAVLFA